MILFCLFFLFGFSNTAADTASEYDSYIYQLSLVVATATVSFFFKQKTAYEIA